MEDAVTGSPAAIPVAGRTGPLSSGLSPGLSPGLLVTGASAIVLALYLQTAIGWRQAALFLVGTFAGVVLYHAAFGFTSAWRLFIADRRGAGLRAQMLMLAITCAVFFPLLAAGSIFGQPIRGSIAPPGVSVIAGAFLFGIGMQLGGGCASGTLFTAGGGNTRMVITLLFFMLGALVQTSHAHMWTSLPAWQPTSLVTVAGPWLGLIVSFALFGGIAWMTRVAEIRAHGRLVDESPAPPSAAYNWRWLRGPWPLVAGAIGLAIVNIATLMLAGRPWGVTSAFALWAAKGATMAGVDVGSWTYWTEAGRAAALRQSVFADVTSVMDFGIILGAMLAAILANRFRPTLKISGGSLAAAIIGGLLLGYGARAAYGCNIGAYFSGIASGSLHGWFWLVAAFAGNAVGTSLRPLFGLSVERTRVC